MKNYYQGRIEALVSHLGLLYFFITTTGSDIVIIIRSNITIMIMFSIIIKIRIISITISTSEDFMMANIPRIQQQQKQAKMDSSI